MNETREKILNRAEFDPKLKLYWYLQGVGFLAVTIAGIPLLPVWFLGWGNWYCRRSFEALQCILTERSLLVKRGILFRVEKTIPLDKIQDLTLKEGPLLRWFGLCSLQVETAGQSGQAGGSEGSLVGVVDIRNFRNAVLDQRDRISGTGAVSPALPGAATGGGSVEGLLGEIRDSLRRIEKRLTSG